MVSAAYIVDAVRTPVGRRGGTLSTVHPADLGAHSIKALMERTGVDPNAVDDVVFGNVDSSARRPVASPAPAGWPPVCPSTFPAPRSTVSADRHSRRSTSPPRP
jgi:acetyl-CoA acetyltransferase